MIKKYIGSYRNFNLFLTDKGIKGSEKGTQLKIEGRTIEETENRIDSYIDSMNTHEIDIYAYSLVM